MPNPKPAPIIGPISGDISIAPMITAVEFTFRPIDATTIAQAKIHKLDPLNEMLDVTLSNTSFLSSSPLLRLI
jgi:hypothetical protein